MKEMSLLSNFSVERLEYAKAYIELMTFGEDVTKFRNIFTDEELELIEGEIFLIKDLDGLVNKIERMQIQKEKKPSDSINAVLPIEEYGPFPLEVEKVLRENVIDNMDDLLTRKVNLTGTTTDTINYIEFMKKFYDFSSMDKKNNLTKTK
ncbi:MAG: hypothetical protein E7160_01245 [Firmicutes bacterium]|nr:hypothetical protein [Bacillota bacterium]